MTDIRNILIVGFGDIGRRVASHYTQQGQHITAVCRTAADSEAATLKVDLDQDQKPIIDWLAANPSGQIYWFAPPQKHGVTDERINRFCQALSNSDIKRFVYISTTAVYGDCQGRWIDEEEPLKPGTDRGKRRQNAEQCLQIAAKEHGFELVVLRVPGIYGPGRWPLARLKKGLPVLKEAESPYTNRIHQDDLANICVTAMNQAPVKAGEWRAYNCSDGHPSTMTDYFNQIADAFDIARPPQLPRAEAEQQLTPGMLSFMNESKRLNSDRVWTEFKTTLSYSSLAEALN